MEWIIVLELVEILLIATILVVDILALVDARAVKRATLTFWAERARWYAARGRPRELVRPEVSEPNNSLRNEVRQEPDDCREPEVSLLREVVAEEESQPVVGADGVGDRNR